MDMVLGLGRKAILDHGLWGYGSFWTMIWETGAKSMVMISNYHEFTAVSNSKEFFVDWEYLLKTLSHRKTFNVHDVHGFPRKPGHFFSSKSS